MAKYEAHEIEELAELVAEKVAAKLPKHVCQLTDDELRFVRVAYKTGATARATAWAAAIGLMTITFLSALGWGVVHMIQKAAR